MDLCKCVCLLHVVFPGGGVCIQGQSSFPNGASVRVSCSLSPALQGWEKEGEVHGEVRLPFKPPYWGSFCLSQVSCEPEERLPNRPEIWSTSCSTCKMLECRECFALVSLLRGENSVLPILALLSSKTCNECHNIHKFRSVSKVQHP